MGYEDRLKKQIDQLGKVLGRILADLLGIKNQGGASMDVEIIQESLQSELDLNVDQILDWPLNELIQKLQAEKKFENIHLELFADILYNLDDGSNQTRKIELLESALVIYEYVQANSNTYSFERQSKINRIKSYLN